MTCDLLFVPAVARASPLVAGLAFALLSDVVFALWFLVVVVLSIACAEETLRYTVSLYGYG